MLDALAALGSLGHRTVAVAELTRTEGELRRLLEHLTIPGGVAR